MLAFGNIAKHHYSSECHSIARHWSRSVLDDQLCPAASRENLLLNATRLSCVHGIEQTRGIALYRVTPDVNDIMEGPASHVARIVTQHALGGGIHVLKGAGCIDVAHTFSEAAENCAIMRAELICLLLRRDLR